MIGINADLPVREAPVIMLTASESNDRQRGECSVFRGHNYRINCKVHSKTSLSAIFRLQEV